MKVVFIVMNWYLRRSGPVVKKKNGFSFLWQKRRSSQIIKPDQKKYDEIRKGTWHELRVYKNSMIIVLIGFLLATAYSASIGGLSTVVGTTTNVFAKGFIEEWVLPDLFGFFYFSLISTYESTTFRINFLNFLLLSLPAALIMLILCWVWLQVSYNRKEFVVFILIVDHLFWNIDWRFFQCRADPQAREINASVKLMLRQQYKELGRPK